MLNRRNILALLGFLGLSRFSPARGIPKRRVLSVLFFRSGYTQMLDDSASANNLNLKPAKVTLPDTWPADALITSTGSGHFVYLTAGSLRQRVLSDSIFGLKNNRGGWIFNYNNLDENQLNSIAADKVISESFSGTNKFIAISGPNYKSGASFCGIYSLRQDNSLYWQGLYWNTPAARYALEGNPVLITSQIANVSSMAAGADGLLFFVINGSIHYYVDTFYATRHYPFPPYNQPITNFSLSIFSGFSGIKKIAHGGDKILYCWLDNGDLFKLIYRKSDMRVMSYFKIHNEPYDQSAQIVGEFSGRDAKVSGYAWPLSVFTGQEIKFYTSSTNPHISAQFVNFGWHNNTLTEIALAPAFNIQSSLQRSALICSQENGFDWPLSYVFKPPFNWGSGYYFLKLSNRSGEISYIPFIVKNGDARSEILVLANTNTWTAYNTYGINGNYTQSYQLNNTFKRPMNIDPNYFSGGPVECLPSEVLFFAWLRHNNFSIDVISDFDFHSHSYLRSDYKCLVMHSHPEYWSAQQRSNLVGYLQSGGNLAYLGGNGIYAEITYTSGGQINFLRPELFRLKGQDETQILGVSYQGGSGLFSSFAANSAAVNHWVFAGTNITSGQIFGATSYRGDTRGASGGEFDVMNSMSSQYSGLVYLAKGQNIFNGKVAGADMILFPYGQNSAQVFSASSINFTCSLFTDQIVSAITKNVLNTFKA